MNKTQLIIKHIENASGVWTTRERMKLMDLAFAATADLKKQPKEPVVIEVLDQFLEYKGSYFNYLFNAHVLYLNQVVEVVITGSLDHIILHSGNTGGYYEAPSHPDTLLKHGAFDEAIVHLVGDVDEAPFPMQEKAMIDLVVDFFSEEKYDELVDWK